MDILFCSWNRLAFTQASFGALLEHTNWEHVERLVVHDDGSEDGTADWLAQEIQKVPADVATIFNRQRHGGPVAAMNWYLDTIWPGFNAMIKIDNDFIVCPGWLDDIRNIAARNLDVDVIGFAPQLGPSVPTPFDRDLEPARFIGGIGLIRHRIFEACRPVATGRFGWGAFQERHGAMSIAWVKPDLPMFELDRLPMDPWASLSASYVRSGWQRDWGPYDRNAHGYWDWFVTPESVEVKA